MLKLLITLDIAAALYFVFFNDKTKIAEEVDKEPEVPYQPQNEKSEGIDPSISRVIWGGSVYDFEGR